MAFSCSGEIRVSLEKIIRPSYPFRFSALRSAMRSVYVRSMPRALKTGSIWAKRSAGLWWPLSPRKRIFTRELEPCAAAGRAGASNVIRAAARQGSRRERPMRARAWFMSEISTRQASEPGGAGKEGLRGRHEFFDAWRACPAQGDLPHAHPGSDGDL